MNPLHLALMAVLVSSPEVAPPEVDALEASTEVAQRLAREAAGVPAHLLPMPSPQVTPLWAPALGWWQAADAAPQRSVGGPCVGATAPMLWNPTRISLGWLKLMLGEVTSMQRNRCAIAPQLALDD
jgi:hypothetical protein